MPVCSETTSDECYDVIDVGGPPSDAGWSAAGSETSGLPAAPVPAQLDPDVLL